MFHWSPGASKLAAPLPVWFAPHWQLPLTSQPEIAQARLFSHANPERSQSETTAAGNDRCNCCCKTPKVVLSLTKLATALMAQVQPHPTLHVLTTADTAISYRNIRFLRDPQWTGTCITEEGGKANMTRTPVQFTIYITIYVYIYIYIYIYMYIYIHI